MDQELDDWSLNDQRKLVEKITLPSTKPELTPSGVTMRITAAPHRDGNPDHTFYEAWFYWEGVTIRSSTIIHNPDTRDSILEMLHDMTGIIHDDAVNKLLDKYDWKQTDDSRSSTER